ncbi:MAG: type IV pilin [Poseidonia sp.]
MLGNKKNQKKTVFGGIGIALLLCALMVLMPMSGYVDNNESAEAEFVEANSTGDEEDFFKLPETLAEAEYEYDPSLELQGMRDEKTKAYLNEDGSMTQMIASEPLHYMSGEGTWENIDLNIKAGVQGWSVTENTFVTHFAPEAANGISVQANEWVDPIISGLNPMLVTLDVTGSAPEPFITAPSPNGIEVGGNVIRYPLAEGYDLDYTVESTQVKQNLVIREAPVLPEAAAWFGLSEGLRMPAGYALFSGETELGEELFQTQEALQVRNVETGEILVEIPSPMIIEPEAGEPYMGTFFVQVYGPEIILITVVDADWITSDDRVFPIGLDPSIRVNSNSGGYCYKYYAYCYTSSYRYHYRYYGYYYYVPWHKYTFTSSNQLPSGATVDKIEFKKYMNYGNSGNRNAQVKVLEGCGTAPRYSWTNFGSSSCNGNSIAASYLARNYGGTAARSLIASIGNSPSAGTVNLRGTGWKTVTMCNSATACAATTGGVSIISDAVANTGTVGIGEFWSGGNVYFYTYAYASGSRNSHILVTYSGGTDADPPTSDFVPYTGIDSYIEGERTFHVKLTDMSGIDTTSSGAPQLYYSTDGGTSWSSTTYGLGSNNQLDAGELISIGTCGSTTTDCYFKARTDDLSYGDDLRYYWKYQDLNQGSNGANVGYTPALTGTQTTPTPYQVDIVDPANAPTTHKKMTVLTTDVHASSQYNPQGFLDRQMTYYSDSDEYFFEFDTSNCGTGSTQCFYSGTSTFYNNWLTRWNQAPATGSYGMNSGTNKGNQNMQAGNGGYLQITAADGPGMNLIYHYDATKNLWGVVGVGTETGIDAPLTGGAAPTQSLGYGVTQAYKFAIPGDITGDFGTFKFNSTGSSTTANRMCVTTNGWYYFYRAASYDRCTSAYYMIYNSPSSYRWSGFTLGSGYYGRQASTGDMSYKVGNVAPTPDTFKPDMMHTAMKDSHAKTRTVSVSILDAGDPAAGLNTSSSAGVGPTLYHRITPDGGTAGTWTSTAMTQEAGKSRADCALSQCTWSADIEDLEVNDTVEYYFTSRDTSTVSAGINVNTSSTYSFERGDPNKVFVVEWHDRQYYTYGTECTVQAAFYDVTNEIEFKYDSGCKATYNSWSIGYMDQTRSKGASIAHSASTSFNSNPGHTPTASNFRISTDSTSHGWESFDKGLVELANANTALSGTSNGRPYLYYCISSYYWNTYKNSCNANIDIPAGFEFEYFGTTYDGDDSNDRIQLSRQGSMYFIDNGNTNLERNLWTYHQPALPYSGSSLARPGTIAPFWTGYNAYYCYTTSSTDCSTYYRVMPYEGKGTDVTSDITSDPHWDLTDSPIRINPTNKYLTVSSDLTIEPGVQIQIAAGKGISFDGSCTKFTAIGNSTNPINFTGMNGADWLGMAFTDDCTTSGGTDDRHQFSYVNFNNTEDAVFRSGSRHDGTGPSCGSSTADCNTGNYTMSEVTFTDVGAVFTHGSGQGTVVTMMDFTIDGVDESCFYFAENTMATLLEGTMKNCNTDGNVGDGAIMSVAGSSSGMLVAENLTVENAYRNFVNVDLQDVRVSNVTVTNTAAQTGAAIKSDAGAGSDVYINNVDIDSYADVSIFAMDSMILMDADFGTADMMVVPGGTSQTGNGPSSSNAVLDTVTAGDISMQRIHPGTFTDITAGDVTLTGSAITNEVMEMDNFDIGAFTVTGCSWIMELDAPSLDSFKSSASCTTAKNLVTISDATITHTSTTIHVIDGRNSHITVGETSITSTSASNSVGTMKAAKARSGTNIVLVDVSFNSNDCSDSNGNTGNCPVDISSSSSNPSMVYYGGLANASLYRLATINGQQTRVYKADHVVTASLLDSNNNELFQVGKHVTDADGNTSVWVVVDDDDGTSYADHIVRAFGTAGQNETYPDDYPDITLASDWYPSGGYTWGTHLDLLLEPAPIVFNDPALDCYKLINDAAYSNLSGNYDASTNVFTFDDTSITVAADLMLDGCGFEIQGGSLRVLSTATSTPVITLKDGGSITANDDGTSGNPAAIRAVSPTYGLHLDIQNGGSLTLDHANMRDIAQDTATDAALLIGNGASLTMLDSATIFGSTASSDDMATVKVDGGSLSISASSIINTGQTGTALWIENAGATVNDVIVKNAAVGIQSYNGAPQVDGFTSNGNTVGIAAYGGMSLPTIYRSTALSGASNGWTTYQIDLSSYLGTGNFLQVGANSIWAGGNAHPSYNYASSKYYFITDRMNIEFEDDNGNSWNVTDAGQEGYYPYGSNDPAVTAGTHSYNGGDGGAPSWHCNYYGAESPGNNYGSFDGYFYYLYRYWLGQSVSYPDYYEAPDEFGFDWEQTEISPTGTYQARYPYKYWGYYSPSFYFNGVYAPPEGSNGQPSSGPGQPGNVGNPPSYASGGYPNNYGVCLDYAYTYYMNSGQGARMTFPVVDISNSVANGGNISKLTLWMDVLHRGADNYQDRYDFVARAGNNPADLGDYMRESGTPLFKEGSIIGADYGVQVGGAFTAGHFEDIDVTNPTQAGLNVVGQSSVTTNRFNVSGGNYGVLVAQTASGGVDLENIDLENQLLAGIYYQNDLGGDLTGSITGSAGAAFKYSSNTDTDVTMNALTIQNNAVGIDAGGDGDFTLTDVTMSNTKDVVISGSSVMDYIEGSVDTSTIEVTGTGEFLRMRQVDVTLQANVSNVAENVVGTNVVLKDASGEVTGMAETDANGVAHDMTYTTQTVDSGSCASVCVLNLGGYSAVAVAEIAYSWTSSSVNNADFRYDFHDISLTDSAGNADTMYLEDSFTARICYSSTSYVKVARCSGYLSSTGSRVFNSGQANEMTEYGYLRSHSGNDLAGETVMMDAPFMYLASGKHNWNGSTWISTASYDFDNANRMYPYYSGETTLYMNDATVTAVAVSNSGDPQGFNIGYRYYSLNTFMNNTTISGIATLNGAMGYGYYNSYELDDFQITNNTFVHFKGYTELNNAISYTDICMVVGGGEGNIVSNNNFVNCGVGVMLERSPYYYSHNTNEVGADNMTIADNTFTKGGEIADVWLYSSNEAQGVEITGNDMSPSNGHAIAVYSGATADLLIQNNDITGGDDAIYLVRVNNFTVDSNDIGGIADPTSTGISISEGSGDITDNTLTDADGGIYLDGMEAPPSPTSSLCSIGRSDYRSSDTCSWTLAAGKSAELNLGTDSWGYEISLEVTKPDGTKDTWGTYSFSSNWLYSPLRTYSDAGNYTLVVSDSWGDGGADIDVLESSSGSSAYAGPDVSGNTIGLSAGRVSPNAVGISAIDCDGVSIQSSANSITLGDNAIVIEDCSYSDVGSTLTGSGTSSTVGILTDSSNNPLTLNGTDISGFATGVDKENGDLVLIGDATIAGTDYGVYADDVNVIAIDASVDGGSTGTGLHVINSDDVWVYPMDASGYIGMYVENTPFRWDGGVSDATTALAVKDAEGSVENLTWSASSVQIDAQAGSHVTSIGNTLDPSKINVATSAVIDEANLMSIEATHLGASTTSDVALLLMSTDKERASYVSTTFQPEAMSVDGSNDDWVGGNALNPSGYAMPGTMSGDGTDDFLVTYIEGDGMYFGMTNSDLSNSDVLIYISTDSSGSDVGYNGLGGAHNLPFNANYVLWADSESSYDLYSYGFLGWGPSSLSTANVDVDFSTSLAEISLPWSRIGGMPSEIDIVAVVQSETTADISVAHPSQTLDSAATLQNLSKFMTVELTHDDLTGGSLSDEVLVYQSYKGSATASGQKNYDLMVKTVADCAYDWATVEDISMATNVVFNDGYVAGTGDTSDVRSTIDILRACPVIDTEGTDTDDGLVDFSKDEDSGSFTFSLTNLADDVQDEESSLSWVVTDGTLVAHDNVLVDWAQNGQDVTITPLTDQFGYMVFSFEVTDSNGLVDSHNITYTVNNINDKPVICNVERSDCMPIFSEDDSNYNILPEGFGTHTKFLGDVSNATRSYIRDMANEQSPARQVYTWTAGAVDLGTTDACSAFSVDIVNNELTITENTNNELGGKCTVTLGLADDGAENQNSDTLDVVFSVAPVNDAPVILDWNRTTETVMVADNGSIPALPWSISLMEDDENVANLTYDMSAIKTDIDHEMDDLVWTVESTDQCVYTNYFTTTIVGDDLVFDLIEDATTNANDWEIDYLNNNGIHQIGPSGSEYCQIRLVLRDTPTAPTTQGEYNTFVPNYDPSVMAIADYQQGVATKEIGVRVENVREQVPDYAFDDQAGFNFNGVTNVMTGTYVPVTVGINGGGDEGPYRYDHMLAITYHTDGHDDVEQTRYYAVPDYGATVKYTEDVYVTKDTTHVWVEMDVVTCLANPCDMSVTTADRFQADEPGSHYAIINNVQSDDPWSKPGQYGKNATKTSERRPLLEDSNWCNNIMTSLATADVCNHANQPSSNFLATSQNLPDVVETIGASSVPSFAPSIVAVALTGLFVSALSFSSRRADDEEEVESMSEDDAAVSPVIATILMVAITVVLSGVIYVWASSLAETDVKGVPRVTFDIEDINGFDADEGHWRITVEQSQTELATQAVEVKVFYLNATGALNTFTVGLADSNGVYGFNPANSDAFVTFVDSVNKEQISENESRSISTFNSGDTIFIRTHAPDGTPLVDATITLSYAPINGDGALLRTWDDLSYDKKA